MDASSQLRSPAVSTLRRPPPRQPVDEAGDQRLIDVSGCDPLALEPPAEDRRGADVTSNDAGCVPAAREDVDEVVEPLTQRPRPDLLADVWANRERFKHGLLLGPRCWGTHRRPYVLCKARREVDACHARDSGTSPTVTCHNPVVAILTRMSRLDIRVSFECRLTSGGSNGCRPRAWKFQLQHRLLQPSWTARHRRPLPHGRVQVESLRSPPCSLSCPEGGPPNSC